jgi:hypothetical protein
MPRHTQKARSAAIAHLSRIAAMDPSTTESLESLDWQEAEVSVDQDESLDHAERRIALEYLELMENAFYAD